MTAAYLESPPVSDNMDVSSIEPEPTAEENATIDSHIEAAVATLLIDDASSNESATETPKEPEPIPEHDAYGRPLPSRDMLLEKCKEQYPEIPKWFLDLTVDHYLYQLVKGLVPME